MHDPPLRQIVGVGVMLRHPVIPDSDIVRLPAPAHLKLRFSDMSKQEVQQRCALFLTHLDNSRGKPFINEQRLLAGHRVGTHYRVQQRRMLRHRFLPAPMLGFGLVVLILLERFAEIMFGMQAAQQLPERF